VSTTIVSFKIRSFYGSRSIYDCPFPFFFAVVLCSCLIGLFVFSRLLSQILFPEGSVLSPLTSKKGMRSLLLFLLLQRRDRSSVMISLVSRSFSVPSFLSQHFLRAGFFSGHRKLFVPRADHATPCCPVLALAPQSLS